ncbi:protein of unknown function [Shinella sp. WSC3-e]|nr:hypothetical protein SHINE37_44055 [Rhizobiaceae bacterium]CAK7258577.1 protein of unknown function [Shinella sp. WSC3-e]
MHGLQAREIDELLVGEVAELHPARLLVGIQHRLVDRDIRDLRLVLLLVIVFLGGCGLAAGQKRGAKEKGGQKRLSQGGVDHWIGSSFFHRMPPVEWWHSARTCHNTIGNNTIHGAL